MAEMGWVAGADGFVRTGSDGRGRGAGVEVVPTLAAKYNGGKELHDGSGHLPRDGDGFYLSRTTGERLVVDSGWGEGDAIGAQRIQCLPGSVVVGSLATSRLAGFSGISDSNYAIAAFSTSTVTVVALTTATTTLTAALLDSAVADPRFLVRTRDNFVIDGALAAGTSITQLAGGTDCYIVSGYDAADGTAGHGQWETDGTKHQYSEAVGDAGADFAGSFTLGRRAAAGASWPNDIDIALATDGTYLSEATIQSIIDDHVAGATMAELKSTYGLALAAEGVVCGAYDPASASTLFTSAGSGDDVTAEYT